MSSKEVTGLITGEEIIRTFSPGEEFVVPMALVPNIYEVRGALDECRQEGLFGVRTKVPILNNGGVGATSPVRSMALQEHNPLRPLGTYSVDLAAQAILEGCEIIIMAQDDPIEDKIAETEDSTWICSESVCISPTHDSGGAHGVAPTELDLVYKAYGLYVDYRLGRASLVPLVDTSWYAISDSKIGEVNYFDLIAADVHAVRG